MLPLYHDELLKQATESADRHPACQADLRRAVSTAYYALFHLLISDTVANWSDAGSRAGLARMFEHSTMKRASKRISDAKTHPFAGEDLLVVKGLRDVAETFVELQDKRQIADYDNATLWAQSQAISQVESAIDAFETWSRIRHETIAKDYLVSLLIKPRD